MKHRYYLVDVFTNAPFSGAQLAVFPWAETLNASQMTKLANELSFGEVVFVSPPADKANTCRLTIYKKSNRQGFGSHTTVAAGHVLGAIGYVELKGRGAASLRFEFGGQVLPVIVDYENSKPIRVQMELAARPNIDFTAPTQSELTKIFGVPESAFSVSGYKPLLVGENGVYLVVPVNRYDDVRNATFNEKAWSETLSPATCAEEILLVTRDVAESDADFHMRLLGAGIGAHEDPPVGSSIPAFCGFLCGQESARHGMHPFTVIRGTSSTRLSTLTVEMCNDETSNNIDIRVGGEALIVGEGVILEPLVN